MLAIARKRGEEIEITVQGHGKPMRIVVLGIEGGRVSLGFDGPPEMRVNRTERLARVAAAPTLSDQAGEPHQEVVVTVDAPPPPARRAGLGRVVDCLAALGLGLLAGVAPYMVEDWAKPRGLWDD